MARAFILVHERSAFGFRFPPRHFRSEHCHSSAMHGAANPRLVIGYPEYLVILDIESGISRIKG